MVKNLIRLIVVALVLGLLYRICTLIPLPNPFLKIVLALFLLVFVLSVLETFGAI